MVIEKYFVETGLTIATISGADKAPEGLDLKMSAKETEGAK